MFLPLFSWHSMYVYFFLLFLSHGIMHIYFLLSRNETPIFTTPGYLWQNLCSHPTLKKKSIKTNSSSNERPHAVPGCTDGLHPAAPSPPVTQANRPYRLLNSVSLTLYDIDLMRFTPQRLPAVAWGADWRNQEWGVRKGTWERMKWRGKGGKGKRNRAEEGDGVRRME